MYNGVQNSEEFTMNTQTETKSPAPAEETKTEKVEEVKKTLTSTQKTEYENLPTKSAKIRFLNALGWKRGDIAKYLDIRYQHVRNVLIMPVKNPKS